MCDYQLLLEIMSRKPPEDPWLEEVERMKDQSVDSLRWAFEKRLYSKKGRVLSENVSGGGQQ